MIELIPAIDIIDGKCVRLSQGDYNTQKVYNENPVEVAKEFEAHGIHRLHIVDLDGAVSRHVVNYRVLDQIASRTSLVIDFGGGIKTDEDLVIAFDNGAQMVTLGSVAVKNPGLFKKWLEQYGNEKIILGADVKENKISVNGWKEESQQQLIPFLKDYTKEGVFKVLCTDISRDGMLHIHAQCQFADVTGLPPESIEAENYIRMRVNAGYKALANEYTVSDNEYFASNIDCVWEKAGRISLVDIKTTLHLDKEYLSWQLSIYAYFFELQNPLLKVDKLFSTWLRGNKHEFVEISRKSDKEVKKLMECEKKGEQYLSNLPVPAPDDDKLLIPMQLVNTIIGIEEELADLTKIQKDYKAKLKTAMRENGVKSWDAGRLRVSYTPASTSDNFDTKKFQADYPELYSKYIKTVPKADSIRVTIREDKS